MQSYIFYKTQHFLLGRYALGMCPELKKMRMQKLNIFNLFWMPVHFIAWFFITICQSRLYGSLLEI